MAKNVLKKKSLVKKPTQKKGAAKKTGAKKLRTKKSLKPTKKLANQSRARKTAALKKAGLRKGPEGLPEQLLAAALKVLDERQADDIVTVDLSGKSAMADYLIIASGRAAKQLAAIAHYLREAFEKCGAKSMRIEGLSEGNWVLMDAGDIIVHLFRPEVRRYYNLEQIWDRSGRSPDLLSPDEGT